MAIQKRKHLADPPVPRTPEESADLILSCRPHLNRAEVLRWERLILANPSTVPVYCDWLDDQGLAWRICELESGAT